MNKKLVIFFILGFLLAGGIYISKKINSEVEGAFDTLSTELQSRFIQKDSMLNLEYSRLVSSIEAGDTLGPAISTQLLSTQKKYSGIIEYINKLGAHLSGMDPLIKENDPYALAFWFGENPQANEGRGDGFAEKLRSAIFIFRKEIALQNEILAAKKDLTSWYQPELLVDGPEVSWEVETFSGPIGTDLAKLEALKLEQAEIFEKEMAFLEALLSK
jgi:hypothetical protein